jgi:hypothetical protein
MVFDESKASPLKQFALQDVRETVSDAHLKLISMVTDLSDEDLKIVYPLVERLIGGQGVRGQCSET